MKKRLMLRIGVAVVILATAVNVNFSLIKKKNIFLSLNNLEVLADNEGGDSGEYTIGTLDEVEDYGDWVWNPNTKQYCRSFYISYRIECIPGGNQACTSGTHSSSGTECFSPG